MPDEDEDWHLQEWLEHFGKRQTSLVHELGWDKNRAYLIWHSKQPYRRDIVNQVADWLGIRPLELLMTPREALALRRLRESAATIVAEDQAPFERPPPKPLRTDAGAGGARTSKPPRRRFG